MAESKEEIMLKKYLQEYQQGNSSILHKALNIIRGIVKLENYYDPSGSRTFADFEQVALIGIWKSFESYQEGKGSSLLSWTSTIIKQHLSKEVRMITREKTETTQHFSQIEKIKDLEDSENYIFSVSSDNKIFNGRLDMDEKLYLSYIFEVESNLSRINLKLVSVFDIKLIWPNIDRSVLASIFRVSRMSISKYFKLIRKVMENVYQKYSEDKI